MSLWLIQPRDPLIVRDGRPFGPDPGVRARSLDFPMPSTTTGAVRTRYGFAHGGFGNGGVKPKEVRKIGVRGPLLVRGAAGAGDLTASLLLPRPHDALLLPPSDAGTGDAASDRAERQWLAPLEVDPAVSSNLPDGLAPIGPARPRPAKPVAGASTFWTWETYSAWLAHPGDDSVLLSALGSHGPTLESRTHVQPDPATQTAMEGMLFQTSGLEFIQSAPDNNPLRFGGRVELALLVETEAEMDEGPDTLGGESRLVSWRRLADALPTCPQEISDAVIAACACRILLATPGYFAQGYLPNFGWLMKEISGLKAEIIGAIVQTYETVSGWDFEHNRPKPTRRLAPAGSAYYLSLEGSSPEAIRAFIDRVWLQNIADDLQARLDGFGLAVIGNWDGALRTVRLEEYHE